MASIELRSRSAGTHQSGSDSGRAAAADSRSGAARRDRQCPDKEYELLGIAAHDLRSPLTVISGYTELLLNDGLTTAMRPEERRQTLRTIHQVSEFMLRLLDDMLDLAVIESGRILLHPAPVEIAALLGEALALHATAAANKSIILLLGPDSAPVTVIADPLKLRQAVDNLIGNAIKYAPAHTAISVGTVVQHPVVRIVVRDQGPGITPAELERIFQPFVPGASRPTGGEKCTGLGLAIARKMVAAHGGRVWAESAPGKGSTFTIELPTGGWAQTGEASPLPCPTAAYATTER